MDKIHISCACDNNYVPHCGALITSIFESNKANQIDINIVTDGFSNENIAKLKQVEQKYNQKINIVKIDISKLSNFPIDKHFNGYINLSTYYRLLLPDLFVDLDKILYLDCDIIVRKSLSPLWNIDLTGYSIASIHDSISMVESGPQRLGYPESESYFNAGVGLYNLDKLRKINFVSRAFDYINSNKDKIKFQDQDVLNGVLHGTFKQISVKWNLMEVFLLKKPLVESELIPDLLSCITTPSVIHYTNVLKPWFKECNHPYKNEYWKYLWMSPWKDYTAKYKYEFSKRCILYIKRYIKETLSCFSLYKNTFAHVKLQKKSL